MESGEGVVLTVVSGEPEAEIVCGLLRSAGIVCAYRDTEVIDSPLEDFTAAGTREILVRDSDLEAAKELLADTTWLSPLGCQISAAWRPLSRQSLLAVSPAERSSAPRAIRAVLTSSSDEHDAEVSVDSS